MGIHLSYLEMRGYTLAVLSVIIAVVYANDNGDDCKDQPARCRAALGCNDSVLKGWMMKNCKRSCIEPCGCKDSDHHAKNCRKWASSGFCFVKKWKVFMKIHCKKSCNTCNVMAIQTRVDGDGSMDGINMID